MLDNSHMMVLQAVDSLPELEWDIPGVCGEWSVKEIVAHLISYELVLADVLNTFLGKATSTPYLSQFIDKRSDFNDVQVKARQNKTAQQVEDEYNDAQVYTTSLLAQISAEKVQQPGTIPWYGKECCLGDFIRLVYDHTCEHSAQIAQFRDRSS
jgi:hypothetical protein